MNIAAAEIIRVFAVVLTLKANDYFHGYIRNQKYLREKNKCKPLKKTCTVATRVIGMAS